MAPTRKTWPISTRREVYLQSVATSTAASGTAVDMKEVLEYMQENEFFTKAFFSLDVCKVECKATLGILAAGIRVVSHR